MNSKEELEETKKLFLCGLNAKIVQITNVSSDMSVIWNEA